LKDLGKVDSVVERQRHGLLARKIGNWCEIDFSPDCGENSGDIQSICTEAILMKSIGLLAVITFALTFCGLSERLKSMSGGSNSGSNSSTTSAKNGGPGAEKATLTPEQQNAIAGGETISWDQQGINWTVPKGWKKMDVNKLSFNYQSPDLAFLLVSVSEMSDDFPMDISLKAFYDQAMQKLKTGDYISVRMLNIDGLDGVEFVEAPPEDKEGVRRHQWMGYRTYLGQKQLLNVMTSTRGSNFDKHKDDFSAIMYSMKSTK